MDQIIATAKGSADRDRRQFLVALTVHTTFIKLLNLNTNPINPSLDRLNSLFKRRLLFALEGIVKLLPSQLTDCSKCR